MPCCGNACWQYAVVFAESWSPRDLLERPNMLENRQRIVMGGWVVAVCSALACMVIAADPPAGPPGAPKVPARDARRKNPIPADDGSRATGKHIFAGNCQPCHGAKGQGNGPVADKLPTPPANLTDSRYPMGPYSGGSATGTRQCLNLTARCRRSHGGMWSTICER